MSADIHENFLSKEDILEQQAVTLYRHVKELSKLKYESELRREDSLIQQSSHMQTAFAFMTAALFMAVPIIFQYRGLLPISFLVFAISTIVLCLLVSLLTASFAQNRMKYEAFPSIDIIEKFIDNNWKQSLKESQQLKQWIDLVSSVQKSKSTINERRVFLIRLSMWSFYLSIGFIVFWFVMAIIK